MLHKIKKRKPACSGIKLLFRKYDFAQGASSTPAVAGSPRSSSPWLRIPVAKHICKTASFIPLLSILALALLSISMISLPWNNSNVVYATEDIVGENAAREDDIAGDTGGVSAQASTPIISLTYSGSNELSNAGSINEGEDSTIVKLEKAITITGELITNYNLQISSNTDSTTLDGPSSITTTTTNANTAEDLADNTWGYSWNNTNYQGITTTPTTIESTNLSSTNNYSINTTKNLSFAAKFNKDAQAGHYKASIKLLLTATPKALVTYTLAYNTNGGSTAPATQTTTSYDDSVQFTISSTKPTKSGYTFLGWSTSSSATTASYQPGGTITLQAATPSQMLWAVWKYLPFGGITTMQEMTTEICAAASVGDTATLTDNRQYNSGVDKTYVVAKFPDNNCWMTQNLRLTGQTITPANSSIRENEYSIPDMALSAWTGTVSSAYYDIDSQTAYYTWSVATAMTGILSGGNTEYSICPLNWSLPSSNEYKAMYESIDNVSVDILRSAPYNFTATGYISGKKKYSTSSGYWWTNGTGGGGNTIDFYVTNSGFGVWSLEFGSTQGLAVRCIAQ